MKRGTIGSGSHRTCDGPRHERIARSFEPDFTACPGTLVDVGCEAAEERARQIVGPLDVENRGALLADG